MIWGIVSAVSFVFAAAKYATHRLWNRRFDGVFLKLHLLAGVLLPVGAGIHSAKMLRRGAGFSRIFTGLVANAGILGLMVSHFFSKQLGKKAMPMHRYSTVLTGLGIFGHLFK